MAVWMPFPALGGGDGFGVAGTGSGGDAAVTLGPGGGSGPTVAKGFGLTT
ncbi:MAG: hypothetical protein AVDCRST_MAG73-4134 [uncultured Thermomicrobiales bacterium]|uniref:Uncharacterized protein n=1 Tax=uncultured Thermomicrobiales bacterium TaxID=1645740 RepID=A0A6J4V671_9BACT|nr:MAG: hypothetical protein AVDCRST_MAG73-4134 [uncultured Thermomicrobiales bacterium]